MIIGDAFLALKPVADAQFAADAQRQVRPALTSLARAGVGLIAGGAFLNTLRRGFQLIVQESEEARKTISVTNALIKATGGVAGVTTEHLVALSEATSQKIGVDDELVQQAGNVLLTFRKVGNELGANNDIYDRAIGLSFDLAQVTGRDATAAMIQLGKALQDPVRGATALSRAGVQFTDAQKNMIEHLVKTNDLLGAQRIVIDEVAREFGGAAEAAATPLDKMRVSIANLAEEVGTAFAPVIDAAAKTLSFTIGVILRAPGPLKALLATFAFLGGTLAVAKLGLTVLNANLGLLGVTSGTAAAATTALTGTYITATGALESYSAAAATAGSATGGLAAGLGKLTVIGAIVATTAGVLSSIGGAIEDFVNKDSTEEFAKVQGELVKSIKDGNTSTAEAKKFVDQWNESIGKLNPELAINIDEVLLQADVQGQAAEAEAKTREETDKLREANKKAREAEKERTQILRELTHVHAQAAQAARDQRSAELSLAGGILGIEGSAQSAQEASRGLADARRMVQRLEAQGRQGTVAWKDAQEELAHAQLDAVGGQLSLAQAVAQYIDENKNSGASTQTAIALVEEYGTKAGLSSGEIDTLVGSVQGLISEYKQLPAGKTTTAEFEDDIALRKIARLRHELSRIPTQIQIFAGVNTTPGVAPPGTTPTTGGAPFNPFPNTSEALGAIAGGLVSGLPPTVVNLNGRTVSKAQSRREVLLTGSGG